MTAAHIQPHTLTEFVNYPDHAERTESPEFGRNKRLLVRQLDLPCWTCGSRDKREVHHLFEWSLWGALDADKVLDTLHQFDPYGFTRKMGEAPIASPDDVRNLLVLCGEHKQDGLVVQGGHHRGAGLGMHDLTFPIFVAQRAVKAGLSITSAIAHVKAVDAGLVGTRQVKKSNG